MHWCASGPSGPLLSFCGSKFLDEVSTFLDELVNKQKYILPKYTEHFFSTSDQYDKD